MITRFQRSVVNFLAAVQQHYARNGLESRISAKMHSDAVSYVRWCNRMDISPIRYFAARHDAIEWKHRILVSRLPSAKFLVKFRRFGDALQRAKQDQERIAGSSIDGSLPVEDTQPMWEQTKAQHHRAGAFDLCSVDLDMTGGWSASSVWCQVCPVSEKCRGMRVSVEKYAGVVLGDR